MSETEKAPSEHKDINPDSQQLPKVRPYNPTVVGVPATEKPPEKQDNHDSS